MRLWGYYALHTFINTIKKIFKSKVMIVILCSFLIGGVVGGSVGFISSLVEDQAQTESSVSKDDKTNDPAQMEEDFMTVHADAIRESIPAATMILLLVVVLWGIYGGSKKGSDFFLMADANILFAAPLKAQTVLMFRLSFQMLALLFFTFYLIFQVPSMKLILGLDNFAIVAIFLAWGMLLFMSKLMSVFTYTLTATYEHLKKYVVPFVFAVGLLVVAATGAVYISTGNDYMATLRLTYGADWSNYIPVFGWYKAMVMNAINGHVFASLGYMALNFVFLIALVWGIWHIKADFYEDALAGAQKRDDMTKAALEGRNINKDKKQSAKRTQKLEHKVRKSYELKGWGASVFLHKSILNRRRFSKFGFVTNTLLLYLAIGGLGAAFMAYKTDLREISVIGLIMALTLFFRNFGNPIEIESSHNWLFLVPEDPYKKVLYAILAGSVDCVLDLLPGIVVATVILRGNPLMALLWLATLVSMDFMFSCFGLLLQAILPSSAMDVVKSMLQMMLRAFIIVVIVIAFAIGTVLQGLALGAVFCMFTSLAVGTICFIVYPSLLHRGIG
ncbi:MAG: putative ABC exporter domain-containing protein [Lachnobacterium sp.]|nr:putative ABC exporter domain-containing protein [Lachnobacterium sp.]MDY5460853.1 putative ABC exporter domain-containing protein [Agathobacter sp.]